MKKPTTQNTVKVGASLPAVIELTRDRVDSRLVAQYLDTKHRNTFELISDHKADFNELGLLRFETGKVTGGRPEKFALLNEDHCYLLLTYSRNTARVRELKIRLVKAFRDARLTADTRKAEYLPTYHRLHDGIHVLASGSPNEHFVHSNINKLVNKAAGVEAGQRGATPLAKLSMLAVGQTLAAGALHGALDHHDGYQRVKRVLQAFEAIAQPLQLAADDNG